MTGRRVPPTETAITVRLFDLLRQHDSTIAQMPVIVADEIAQQLDALPTDDDESYPADAYGVCVPPFAEFFVEADTVLPGVGLVQRGALVRDLTADWRDGALQPSLRAAAPAGTARMFSVAGYIAAPPLPGGVWGYDGLLLVHLDADGRLLDDTTRMHVVTERRAGAAPAGARMLPPARLAGHVPFLLKSLSAMHARCEADKASPTRAARRAAARQGVHELHEYYILRVKPTQRPRDISDVAQPRTPAWRRAHLVRGHFRIYTEQAPLFGRIVGAVWIPAHERGDSALGKIRKDYKVSDDGGT